MYTTDLSMRSQCGSQKEVHLNVTQIEQWDPVCAEEQNQHTAN
jgi:hypothetical protein